MTEIQHLDPEQQEAMAPPVDPPPPSLGTGQVETPHHLNSANSTLPQDFVDEEEDEEQRPAVAVVIDEDDGSVVVPTNGPEQEAAVPPLHYQDHNYDMGRPVVRTNSARIYFGENNEPFPVIDGLASYIGEDEHNNTTEIVKQGYRRMPASGLAQNSQHTPPVLVSRSYGGAQQMRTLREGGTYSPALSNNMQQVRRIGNVIPVNGQQQLPAVFNPRRVIRPSTMGDAGTPPILRVANHPIAGHELGSSGGYTRYATIATPNQRRIASPIVAGNNISPAALNDPSRAANDNAPAPFIIPSRGLKQIPRGRVPQQRGVSLGSPPTMGGGSPGGYSPRKVYQLGRSGEYVATNDMHSYVKSRSDISSPPGKDSAAEHSSTIIDVVAEEEAQNAKFFQRQSQSIGVPRQKQPQRVSFNADQQPMDAKSSSSSEALQRSPQGRARQPDSAHNVPPILQRGARAVPAQETYSPARSQSLSDPALADHEALIAQRQRQRGRPRGARLSFGSPTRSPNDFELQRPQQGGFTSPSSSGQQPATVFSPKNMPPSASYVYQQQQQDYQQAQPSMNEPQYQHQRLEDLAELAQQQGFAAGTQRPVYTNQVASPPHSMIRASSGLDPKSGRPYASSPQFNQTQQQQQYYGEQQGYRHGYNNAISSQNNNNFNEASFGQQQQRPASLAPSPAKPQPKGKKIRNLSTTPQKPKRAEQKKEEENQEDSDWEGDYTTRCFCGMMHNDEFMIECERCKVWQHGACMGVTEKNVPELYFCELCQPRPLKHSKQEAIALQEKKFSFLSKVPSKKAGAKKSIGKSTPKGKKKVVPAAKPTPSSEKKPAATNAFKKFVEITENQYSRGVRSFINLQQHSAEEKGDITLLEKLKGDVFARQMFVASNVEGLVATKEVVTGAPVIEYNGCFSLAYEAGNRDKTTTKHNFVLCYTGFGEENSIFIDATKMGSAARFARRSCRPNTALKHVILDGKLHVILVATENIDFSAEVTIPFDYDYRTSVTPVSCACSVTDDQLNDGENCEVRKFNHTLLASSPSADDTDGGANANRSPVERSSRLSSGESVKKRTTPRNPVFGNATGRKKLSFHAKKKMFTPKVKAKSPVKSGKSSPIKSSPGSDAEIKPEKDQNDSSSVRRSNRTLSASSALRKEGTSSVDQQQVNGKQDIRLSPIRKRTISQDNASSPPSTSKSGRRTVKEEEPKEAPKRISSPPAKSIAKEEPKEEAKMTREERKLREAVAAIERQEKREKQKQEKRPGNDSRNADKTKPIQTMSEPQRKLLRHSKPEDIAKQDNETRNLATTPITGNKMYKRASTASESIASPPSKRKRNAGSSSQLLEAAQLLTELSSSVDSSPTGTRASARKEKDKIINFHAQYVQLVDIVLSKEVQNKEFSLGADFEEDLKKAKPVVVQKPIQQAAPLPPPPLPTPQNTKAVKKLTIDEYKRRRSTAAKSAEASSSLFSPKTDSPSADQMSKAIATRTRISARQQQQRPSFIPLQKNTASVLNELSLPTLEILRATSGSGAAGTSGGSTPTVSLDELKRRVLGGKTAAAPSKEAALPSPPPQSIPSSSSSLSTNVGEPPSNLTAAPRQQQAPPPPPPTTTHRMNLDERLKAQFGIVLNSSSTSTNNASNVQTPPVAGSSTLRAALMGRSSMRQSSGAVKCSDIPPPGQLPVCPAPVGRVSRSPPPPPPRRVNEISAPAAPSQRSASPNTRSSSSRRW